MILNKENNMTDFGKEKDPDWKELDDKAKIERLSAVVRRQDILLCQITRYLELLVDHDHMSGRIVQPIEKPASQFQNKKFPHSGLKRNWLY